MRVFLDKAGYDYSVMEEAHDFGQPLKSKAEARSFFETYAMQNGGYAGGCIFDEVEKKLAAIVKTSDADYPYYYPHVRDAAIFVIKGYRNGKDIL
jgi:hypothetical protein